MIQSLASGQLVAGQQGDRLQITDGCKHFYKLLFISQNMPRILSEFLLVYESWFGFLLASHESKPGGNIQPIRE